MAPYFRSIIAALLIAAAVLVLTVRVVAPKLPPVVGRPDVAKEWSGSWSKAEQIALRNADGFVRVTPIEGDTVTVKAEIKAFAHGPDGHGAARAYVDSMIEVTQNEGTLRIVTEPDRRPDSLDILVFYRVLLPVGTDVDIDSANGNVWVDKGCGEVAVSGSNADISVDAPQQHVVAQTVNGRIRLRQAPRGGLLKTVNGSIIADVRGGFLRATTTNGVIKAQLHGQDPGGCELVSQNGDITLTLDEDCIAKVLAKTNRGVVSSEYQLDGTIQRRHLEVTIGNERHRTGEPAQLTLDTLNGNIVIARSRS